MSDEIVKIEPCKLASAGRAARPPGIVETSRQSGITLHSSPTESTPGSSSHFRPDSNATTADVAVVLQIASKNDPGAAELLRRLEAGHGETARELAYRLYQTCRRKKWAEEARNYNGLVVSWPGIGRLSRERQVEPTQVQQEMF